MLGAINGRAGIAQASECRSPRLLNGGTALTYPLPMLRFLRLLISGGWEKNKQLPALVLMPHWRVPGLPFATFGDSDHIYFIGKNTLIWFTIPKVQRSMVKSLLALASPLLGDEQRGGSRYSREPHIGRGCLRPVPTLPPPS